MKYYTDLSKVLNSGDDYKTGYLWQQLVNG